MTEKILSGVSKKGGIQKPKKLKGQLSWERRRENNNRGRGERKL